MAVVDGWGCNDVDSSFLIHLIVAPDLPVITEMNLAIFEYKSKP